MTHTHGNDVEELALNTCWALVGEVGVGRLAVWVEDHPDIFPLNYAVDHGTFVFRSDAGTKTVAALTDVPVALEADGFDAASGKAWSVVAKGRAERIERVDDLMGTVDLPLSPWQGGRKGTFVRIVPTSVTGRRFPIADPGSWRTPLSGAPHAPDE